MRQYLPHFTMMHYMVSNTAMNEEGWKWIDALEDDVCQPPAVVQAGTPASSTSSTSGGAGDPTAAIDRTAYYPGRPMPTVVHHCQFFRIGELGFQKRRIEMNIFNCDFPLMVDPDVGVGKLRYKNRDGEIIALTPVQARRNAFVICVLHRSINAMLVYYKRHMCPNGQFNQTKDLNVIHWPHSRTKW